MTVFFTHLRHDHSAHMNIFTFQIFRKSPLVQFLGRDSVVADERVREDEDLPAVTGVRETFRIPRHARVEDDFSITVSFRSKGLSFECRAIG